MARDAGRCELGDISPIRIHAENTGFPASLGETRKEDMAVRAGGDVIPKVDVHGIERLHPAGGAID